MTENDVKFVSIGKRYCESCRKDILHQLGRELKTGKKVKMCLFCDVPTYIDDDGQNIAEVV